MARPAVCSWLRAKDFFFLNNFTAIFYLLSELWQKSYSKSYQNIFIHIVSDIWRVVGTVVSRLVILYITYYFAATTNMLQDIGIPIPIVNTDIIHTFDREAQSSWQQESAFNIARLCLRRMFNRSIHFCPYITLYPSSNSDSNGPLFFGRHTKSLGISAIALCRSCRSITSCACSCLKVTVFWSIGFWHP